MEHCRHEILIVEDDIGMSRAIGRLLTAAGWKIRAFSSAEDFLSPGARDGASMFIFDIELSGMSGLDLYRQLIASEIVPPTIFITGQDCPDIRSQVLLEGAIAFFTKPFAGAELLRVVRRHLEAS